jgi:hypothetical protein
MTQMESKITGLALANLKVMWTRRLEPVHHVNHRIHTRNHFEYLVAYECCLSLSHSSLDGIDSSRRARKEKEIA